VRVYVDSSALLKRSVVEAESDAVEEALERQSTTVIRSSPHRWRGSR
jgi:predicted nucleic acid-binding protein